MRKLKRHKLLRSVPAMWAALFDSVITIFYQPKEYWDGNLDAANEGNPIGNYFMESHVTGIFFLCLAWLIIILFLGYILPQKISRVFLLFTLIIHSWGASSWIIINWGFWPVVAFVLFNSILFYFINGLTDKYLAQDIKYN